MRTLEQYAEEYADNSATTNYQEGINVGKYQGFIKGATSDYVKIEKLRFAIECVLEFRKSTFGLGNSGLEKLQQQLKELEK